MLRRCLRLSLALSIASCALYGCGEQVDETAGVSATTAPLSVGGHHCPTRGEIAGRDIPASGDYYLTTFGGGRDTGHMACGGTADGSWLYVADAWRFGCGARVRIINPTNHHWCVAQVADVGPNICVEQAAGRPVIDASPLVSSHLFAVNGLGWSDRASIQVDLVDPSVALGCGVGALDGADAGAIVDGGTAATDAGMAVDAAGSSDAGSVATDAGADVIIADASVPDPGPPVSTVAARGECDTSGVVGLSGQLIDAQMCMTPGALLPFAPHANVTLTTTHVHAFLDAPARAALWSAASHLELQIDSAFRTLADQYVLYHSGACGLAATPGNSNHETGRAVDLVNWSDAIAVMTAAGCTHTYPSSDPVHFDCPGSDMRSASTRAFQHLWNLNHPDDTISEDGAYGPMTESRLARSPSGGFPTAMSCP